MYICSHVPTLARPQKGCTEMVGSEHQVWLLLFVLLCLLDMDMNFLGNMPTASALKKEYCGLEKEMQNIGNNISLHRELDMLYHQPMDLQTNLLSPSSPAFANLPRGTVVSAWSQNDTSRYACQLESHRRFCDKYNYNWRMFAGTEDFEKEVSLLYI